MSVKQLTEHHLEVLRLKARLSLHLSKCHIVGNHMSRLNYCTLEDHRSEGQDFNVLLVLNGFNHNKPNYVDPDKGLCLMHFI